MRCKYCVGTGWAYEIEGEVMPDGSIWERITDRRMPCPAVGCRGGALDPEHEWRQYGSGEDDADQT